MNANRSAFPMNGRRVSRSRFGRSLRRVKHSCIPVAVFLAGGLFTLAQPVRAQLATTVDEHGKLVFVNGDSPKPVRRSTISPSNSASKAARTPTAAIPGEDTAATLAAMDGRLDRIVRDSAARHQVDPALVKAVINTESGWNTHAVSNKGAVGLMQLIPGTAQRFGVGNLFDPAQNVEGGTTYLKSLLDRYDGDLNKSLAAYNAGEGAVDRSGGVPAYRETQNYVRKVTDQYFRPGSGRNSSLWTPPRIPVRKEVDASGRVVFTNQ
ncbi:MAG: lytic transglycosylase domain-containing protein [Candidatus Acidiferrales bacterium]